MITASQFWKEGDRIDFTPSSDVTAGVPQQLPCGLVGIPDGNIDISESATDGLRIYGIFKVRKTSVVIKAGDKGGYDINGTGVDANTGAWTNLESAMDFACGTFIADAAAADTYGYLILNVYPPVGEGLNVDGSIVDYLDFTSAEPTSPATGARYINTGTGAASTTAQVMVANTLATWNGAAWTEETPSEGMRFWVEDDNAYAVYGGSSWTISAHIADPAATAADPNALTAVTLTENTAAIGGTNDGDLPALVDPNGDEGATVIAGIRENAAMINKIIADITSIRTQLVAAIDDVQANNSSIDSINAVLAAHGITKSS